MIKSQWSLRKLDLLNTMFLKLLSLTYSLRVSSMQTCTTIYFLFFFFTLELYFKSTHLKKISNLVLSTRSVNKTLNLKNCLPIKITAYASLWTHCLEKIMLNVSEGNHSSKMRDKKWRKKSRELNTELHNYQKW